ncbi:hypothetical protein [Neobacillus sp. PS2-9]|uniref:hypothetical protein n=1 Tax=Neobacillus sp. PS2-9 TaxID=3070676 RepID=UPI0027E208FE|nr:hypothetical protein [Neobacillus sp. PS2-9]WML58551.1 hypothetical protein RCG25_01800 [Neobacillus sp. PS2-9]
MSKEIKTKKKVKRKFSKMVRLHVTVPLEMKKDLKEAVDYWSSSMSKEFRSYASKFIAETEKTKALKRGEKLVRKSLIKQRMSELKENQSN